MLNDSWAGRNPTKGCSADWRRRIWVCVCSLRYPAWNAHAPYCHLWPALLCNIFPHYLRNCMILVKKSLNIKCVFWFFLQILPGTFLVLRRNDKKNVCWPSRKVPVILVRFYWNLDFLNRFSKKTEISNFKKIRPLGAELFHADRRADMTKVTVTFRSFANSLKNEKQNSNFVVTASTCHLRTPVLKGLNLKTSYA
jgi:hypothetical protein